MARSPPGQQHARHSGIHPLLPRSPPTRRPTRLFHPFGFLHSRTPLISRAVAGQATHSGTPSIPHPGPPVQNPFAGCPGPLLNLTTPRFGQPLRRHSLDQDGISKSHSHTVEEYGGVDEARCNPCASFCEHLEPMYTRYVLRWSAEERGVTHFAPCSMFEP